MAQAETGYAGSGLIRCVLVLLSLLMLDQPAAAQGPGSVPAGATRIADADELRNLLLDATLYGTFPQFANERWSEYYCRNGSALYVLGSEKERGRWWITDSEACFAYGERESICFATYVLSDGAYFMRSDARDLGVMILGRAQGDIFGMQRLDGMACEDLSS